MRHFAGGDPSCGPLVMERDTGLVWRRINEDETEPIGPVFDHDACPADLEREWGELYRWWEEATETAAAEYRAATAAYYYGINPAGWN